MYTGKEKAKIPGIKIVHKWGGGGVVKKQRTGSTKLVKRKLNSF